MPQAHFDLMYPLVLLYTARLHFGRDNTYVTYKLSLKLSLIRRCLPTSFYQTCLIITTAVLYDAMPKYLDLSSRPQGYKDAKHTRTHLLAKVSIDLDEMCTSI